MSIAELLLSPFVFIIEQLFLFSYSLSGNYGASIILLSFAISLFLLPVFILIERAKKKDDALKLKMKPLVDEIKRCYKGQERYYYLKTLHRQNNYSPLRALIPILSLLLQIPFFIAAYQFLEGFESLKGVRFLFINDLSAPDALFGSINILPIAMTVVNLVTAYFYTRNGNTSERRQMLVVAGVFLVLLFNLPSGLVLYWTMNNVFSFFRMFVTNPEVFKKAERNKWQSVFTISELKARLKPLVPKLKITFLLIIVIGILSQLHWAFGNYFDGFAIRVLGVIAGSFVLTLCIAVLVVFHRISIPLKDLELKEVVLQLWPLFKPLFFIIVSLAIISQVSWAIQYSFDGFLLRVFASVTGGAIAVSILAFIASIYQNKILFRIKGVSLNSLFKGRVFLISFFVLATAVSATQIVWAFNYYFDDIVLRIIAAVLGSWIIAAIMSRVTGLIVGDSRFNISVFRKQLRGVCSDSKIVFALIVLVAIGSQFIWAMHSSFDGIALRIFGAVIAGLFISVIVASVIVIFRILNFSPNSIEVNPIVFYSLFFLSVYFYFASKHYYLGANKNLGIIAFIVVLTTQLIATGRFYRSIKSQATIANKGAVFLLIIIGALQLLHILTLKSGVDLNKSILNINWQIKESDLPDVVFFGIIYTIIIIPFCLRENVRRKTIHIRNSWTINILAVLYIVGFVFLWNPLVIFSSYPSNFDFPAVDILKHNFLLFSITLAALILLYLLMPKKWKWKWLVGLLSMVIVSFLHNTVMPIDVGTLQEGKFLNQDNLAQPEVMYLLESLMILSVIFLVRWILRRKYFKQIIVGLALLNITLVSQGLYESINTGAYLEKYHKQPDSASSISFSKDKENVVFVIADMFHGWYMDKILQENPRLKQELEGFVWYPNTLSISTITASSIGPILAGYDYTIEKLNEDKGRNYEEKITEITQNFHQRVKEKGYDFTSTHFIYSTIDESKFESYLPKWHNSWDTWNHELNIGFSKELGYKLLWENAAFYSAPLFLKAKVYNGGKWVHGEVETNENTSLTKPYNLVRVLPYISDTNNTNPSFINLHTYASHHPWDIIDDDGKLKVDVSPYENNKWTIETFVKWINWMKENGVYDNTKIIILSDHGPHWRSNKGEMDMDIPIINSGETEVDVKEIMMQFALLLVKDFEQKGDLRIDHRFMSNADATAIAFDENNPLKTDGRATRILPATDVRWEKKLWFKNELHILQQYEVTDNMFSLSNWHRVNND